MLLKDCPVGSFVRLDWLSGSPHWWKGVFKVERDKYKKVNYVLDGTGNVRDDIFNDARYQFEIVTPAPSTPNTITLNGKTYKLKPHTEPRLTVIDGVTYEMEEI